MYATERRQSDSSRQALENVSLGHGAARQAAPSATFLSSFAENADRRTGPTQRWHDFGQTAVIAKEETAMARREDAGSAAGAGGPADAGTADRGAAGGPDAGSAASGGADAGAGAAAGAVAAAGPGGAAGPGPAAGAGAAAGALNAWNAPGGPAPPAPAPPARVLRVEVRRDHRGHFPQIPGTGAGTHWVGVASATARAPVVQAVVDPALPAGDPALASLTWTGLDVTPDAANPLEAEVSRATAGKREVTATLGKSSARTTVWSVFAKVRATSGPNKTFNSDATAAFPGATVTFAADIFPQSILVGDRPRLDGANDTPPPGGVSPATGNPLAGGADHHWDFSRKSRVKMINPKGIPLANMTADPNQARFFANAPWGYPARWEEGNDDSSTGDETNDPYGGTMTSRDTPTDNFAHAGGADGDTFEDRTQFQEFVRLELAKTWWVVSHMFPWRIHERVRKVGGKWVDNGTSAAPDNAGW